MSAPSANTAPAGAPVGSLPPVRGVFLGPGIGGATELLCVARDGRRLAVLQLAPGVSDHAFRPALRALLAEHDPEGPPAPVLTCARGGDRPARARRAPVLTVTRGGSCKQASP